MVKATDLVRRVNDQVFHMACLICSHCNKQISTGEQLFKTDENKFVCKEDFETSKKRSFSGKFSDFVTLLEYSFTNFTGCTKLNFIRLKICYVDMHENRTS